MKVWRSPAGQPAWARPALLGAAAMTALSYLVGIAGQQPEVFYAAAVRSMSASWHNFFFGAFDPRGTVSIDKLPGAFWLQALSVQVFGLHLWALNLPQAIEGTLTVLVLYRAVRRLCGPEAAIVAAIVYALSPATVALNRGNISDSLLILLLVCAADATAAAIATRRTRALIVAGVWVGLAFQAKMLQAWLLLPALIAVWVLAAAPRLPRRLLASVGMLTVTAAVSLSWMTVVTLTPQADRPYVDGSRHDSVYQQVFEYNGFSRADTPVVSTAQADGPASMLLSTLTLDTSSRADRVIAGRGGRATGWLLPLAVLGFLVGALDARGRPRNDPTRAACLLWGAWLATNAAAFLLTDTINAYYLAALTPSIAALTGLLFVTARKHLRPRATALPLLVLTAAGTLSYQSWLLAPAPTVTRLVLVAAAAGVVAVVVHPRLRSRALAIGLTATLVAPALASIAIVADRDGPFDTPFEPGSIRQVSQADVADSIQIGQLAGPALTETQGTAEYPAAAYTSLLAAPLIYATGLEILPIGGFRGTTPSPTLAHLIAEIHTGRLHAILVAPPSTDPRVLWVERHCPAVAVSADQTVRTYYCT